MARRRKPDQSRRSKRSDIKRPCPSGKRVFAKPGDAEAYNQARGGNLRVYRCEHCKRFHMGNAIPRSVRRRRAEGKIR